MREALIVSAGLTILPEFLPSELHREKVAEPETETDVGSMPDVDWGMLREFVETASALPEGVTVQGVLTLVMPAGTPQWQAYNRNLDRWDSDCQTPP